MTAVHIHLVVYCRSHATLSLLCWRMRFKVSRKSTEERTRYTGDLTWHYFPKDSKEKALWVKNISKRLEDCEDCEPWFNSFFKNVKPDYMLHLNQLPYVYSWLLIFSTLIV